MKKDNEKSNDENIDKEKIQKKLSEIEIIDESEIEVIDEKELTPGDKIIKAQAHKPLNEAVFVKSNYLITSKSNTSLIENKILAIAMTRIEINSAEQGGYQLKAHLYPGELRRLFPVGTHIYTRLKQVSTSLTRKNMILEDGYGNFVAFPQITKASYINKVLEIEFNPIIAKHLYGLKGGFSVLESAVISNFKRNLSLKLYELFKKDAFQIKKETDGEYYKITYRVAELRFLLGIDDIDDKDISRALSKMINEGSIDWDKLNGMLDPKKMKYKEWNDLYKALNRAKAEMDKKSDIRFEFKGKREGAFTKVVEFKIYNNEIQRTDEDEDKIALLEAKDDGYRQLEIFYDSSPELYNDFVGYNKLTKEDIDLLLMKANFDGDLVRRAIERSAETTHIKDLMSWLIRCIERGGYDDAIETIGGSASTADKINAIRKDAKDSESQTAERVWKKAQSKPEFQDFIKAIEQEGITEDIFQFSYSNTEKFSIFSNWKTGRDLLYGIDDE